MIERGMDKGHGAQSMEIQAFWAKIAESGNLSTLNLQLFNPNSYFVNRTSKYGNPNESPHH